MITYLSLFFYFVFLSAWLIKSAVVEWQAQVIGYHGDPNEPMAAALTKLFILLVHLFYRLCIKTSVFLPS